MVKLVRIIRIVNTPAHILKTINKMKRITVKRIMITMIIGAIALIMGSCQTSKGCNGSNKMIGYGHSTQSVLKNNR